MSHDGVPQNNAIDLAAGRVAAIVDAALGLGPDPLRGVLGGLEDPCDLLGGCTGGRKCLHIAGA